MTGRQRYLGWVAVVTTVLLIISACKRQAPGPGTDGIGPTTFTMVLEAEPKTFDPAFITGMIGIRAAAALFEGLTVYNAETVAPEPGIASAWDVSADQTIYTFTLRPAAWSNGDPVTAADFEYAWQRVLAPATAADYAYMLFPILNAERFHGGACPFTDVGIRAEGPDRLVVTLAAPTPYFLDLTAFVTCLPVHRASVERLGNQWTRPGNLVGNGPFVLAAHTMHDRIVLERNPRYHAANEVQLDRLVMRIIEDGTTAFHEYEAGTIDLITDVPVPIYRKIRDDGRTDLHVFPGLGTYFIRFNVTRPPFDRKDVRQACALAIDNRLITDKVTGAGEQPAASYVPPGVERGSGFTVPVLFDPARAKVLLAAAGYGAGHPFPAVEYLYNTSEDHKRIAHAVCDMLRTNLGMEIVPLNMEWKVYLQKTRELDYTCARSGWFGDYNDPMTFLDMFMTANPNNRTGWSNPEYDRLVTAARSEADAIQRTELFRKAEAILMDEMPVVPIYHYVSRFMFRSDVGGIHPNVRNWIRPGRLHFNR